MNDYLKTNPSLDEITQKEINAQISQPAPSPKKKKHLLGNILIGAGAIIAAPIAIASYVGKRALRHINYKEYKSKDNNKPRSALGKIVTAGKVGLISLAICYPGTTVKTFRNGKNYVINQAGKVWNQITTPPDYKKEAEQVKEEAKQIEKKYNEEQKRVKKLEQKLEVETGLKWEYKGKYEATTSKSSKANAKSAYTPKGEEQALKPNISKASPDNNEVLGFFVQKKGTTLAEIARACTGDYSNWKRIAAYNNKEVSQGNNVTILMGELVKIPDEFKGYSGAAQMKADEAPKEYFVRKTSESLDSAMLRNNINLGTRGKIISYNMKLMPNIRLEQQEVFWIPGNIR